MEPPHDFDALLHDIPGVLSFQWFGFSERANKPRIRVHTKQGQINLSVEIFRSHLSQEMATHIVEGNSTSELPRLILAPAIGTGLSHQFIQSGLCYVDARGNSHFDLESFFVHVEGRTSGSTAATSGIRRAGYQVLFAYLEDPRLLNWGLRNVAALASVSRQPVSTLRRRLVDEGYVIGTERKMRWNPSRFPDAINLWLQGYTATVRPAILKGSFHTRERNPEVLEKQIAQASGIAKSLSSEAFCWGGAAAAHRISPHYRGERTVLHGRGNVKQLLEAIEAVPAKNGNLVILDSIGGLRGESPDLVPPLLAYTELLQEGSERAREAAQILYDKFVALETKLEVKG